MLLCDQRGTQLTQSDLANKPRKQHDKQGFPQSFQNTEPMQQIESAYYMVEHHDHHNLCTIVQQYPHSLRLTQSAKAACNLLMTTIKFSLHLLKLQ